MAADFDEVPSPIDLRSRADAHTWAREADVKRPWRQQVRVAIAETLCLSSPTIRRVLEIGSGPGSLAAQILATVPLESYTLFDFSQPMLDLSRERLHDDPRATFVLGDFSQPDWTRALPVPFDAVVSMQAVHEIRHKRRVLALYQQIHDVLRDDGLCVVCDHVPADASARLTSLHSTEHEQHEALTGAGFEDARTLLLINGLYVCSGRRPRGS